MINKKLNFKRVLGLGISGLMAISSLNLVVFAGVDQQVKENEEDRGNIQEKFDLGNNITGTFDEKSGTLYVKGKGSIRGYKSEDSPINMIKKDIKKIIFDDGITLIGPWAFCGCENLEEVKWPAKLERIGMLAFAGCTSLGLKGWLDLPDSVTKIATEVFNDCENLKAVKLPANLSEDCNLINVFSGCQISKVYFKKGSNAEKFINKCESGYRDEKRGLPFSLNSTFGKEEIELIKVEGFVKLSDNITGMFCEDGTFYVEGIGEMQGYDYDDENQNPIYNIKKSIKKIIFDDGITHIGMCAFYGCENLEEVEWPGNLKTIGQSAFQGCENLKEIKLPAKLNYIEKFAFTNCTSLGLKERLELPDSVTKIGDHSFAGCKNLKEIKLPKGLKDTDNYTFSDCEKLEEIKWPEGLEAIGKGAFEYCKSLGLKGRLELPNSVTDIYNYAFRGCENLKEVRLPANLNFMGDQVFEGCNLTKFYLKEGSRARDVLRRYNEFDFIEGVFGKNKIKLKFE